MASAVATNPATIQDPWAKLANQALLGTERRPFSLPAPGVPLGDLLSRLDSEDPERAMLSAAAAISLYKRAGRLPAVDNRPLPEPSEPEEWPRCSPQAGQHL